MVPHQPGDPRVRVRYFTAHRLRIERNGIACFAGDDIEEMVAAVKSSLQHCCLQLKSKLVKRHAAQQERERKRTLAKHIPNAAAAFMSVLKVPTIRQITDSIRGIWA
jgi:DNA topoisomerase VI subunit B